ncbi:hypothetical protein [Verrucosispora sp. NA02020]|uniref:hypothetical protein n=1 Tax=Verrucosispora sp. NA02020 TaxID=2742132 RepID=UPI0015914336|nr:hypothetical protein [Verrucosispora sp. NA02020]QKW15448.1 hypothetical protein HUT12_23550 [Verrucosispora sp. NA02020]
MQQTTSAHPSPVTEPGEAQRRIYGNYEVILNLPVDGGFSIGVRAAGSPHRYDELSFVIADVDTANLVHRVIREGGEQGLSPEDIRWTLDEALRLDLFRVQQRHDTPSRNRIEHLNRVLDRLESPADTAAVAELVDSLRHPNRPRNFRELRDAHAAGMAADRDARRQVTR